MNEITRIHIAKTPYDIEVGAKKELEKYLRTLESYSQDNDLVNDVEIRITEILAERGVVKNGVIASADVSALKEQLGDPQEFLPDGEIAVGTELAGSTGKKLYRDTDNAVVSGVLSGIAAFFKIDPVWVRLIFILVAFASFGTALLVYVVLAVVVPAAKTAADKLQMTGRPVTVGTIRELNESEVSRSDRQSNIGRKVLLVLLGTGFALAAAVSAGIVITAIVAVLTGWPHGAGSSYLIAALTLGVISGLLFTALMTLGSYASFVGKLTRRVIISSIVVTVLGLATFGIGVGLAQYATQLQDEEIQKSTYNADLKLPESTKNISTLIVDTSGVTVDYIVDKSQAPRGSMKMFTNGNYELSDVTTQLNGDVLAVKIDKLAQPAACTHVWCGNRTHRITIFGPELETITAREGMTLNYEGETQKKLTVTAEEDAYIELASGVIENLQVTADKDSRVVASDATVQNVSANVGASAQLVLGTVATLEVSDKKSCPSGEREARISVWNVTTEKMLFNGRELPTEAFDSGCTEISIESEENA